MRPLCMERNEKPWNPRHNVNICFISAIVFSRRSTKCAYQTWQQGGYEEEGSSLSWWLLISITNMNCHPDRFCFHPIFSSKWKACFFWYSSEMLWLQQANQGVAQRAIIRVIVIASGSRHTYCLCRSPQIRTQHRCELRNQTWQLHGSSPCYYHTALWRPSEDSPVVITFMLGLLRSQMADLDLNPQQQHCDCDF